MKKLSITAATMAALALTTAAVALGDYEPPLPITNITYNSVAKTVTLNWHDYSNITGFKLYVATNLNESPIYWEAQDEAKMGITARGATSDVFDLANTSVTVDGNVTDKAFYRLMAVKGDGICTCGHCGEGGACVHDYPVAYDSSYWTLFEGTQYVYAEAYENGELVQPPHFIWSRYPLPNPYPDPADPEGLIIDPVWWDDGLPGWCGELEFPPELQMWSRFQTSKLSLRILRRS